MKKYRNAPQNTKTRPSQNKVPGKASAAKQEREAGGQNGSRARSAHKKRRLHTRNILVGTLFLLYLLLIAKLTLFRSPLDELMENWTYQTALGKLHTANFKPLHTIKLYIRILPSPIALLNLIGNVVGFVPLGFFPPMLFKKKSWFWRTLSFGLLAILLIESTQLVTGIGEFDVDDILLNMLGVFLGRASYWLFFRR